MPSFQLCSQRKVSLLRHLYRSIAAATVAGFLCVLTFGTAYGQDDDLNELAPVVVESPEVFAADTKETIRDTQYYTKTVKPLMEMACYDCHSEDNIEGNFRADSLDPDLVSGEDLIWWLEVYSVLSKGEMPPEDATDLTDAQRTLIVDWLAGELQAAEKARSNSGNHSSFRRLTKYEYDYALQDLLGEPWAFANDLPAEASEEDAFENNAESLHMSVKQLETYHQLALKALNRVTVRGERPAPIHWAVTMKRAFEKQDAVKAQKLKSVKKELEDEPEKLAARIERIENNFLASADKTHYLDLSTGDRRKNRWDYNGAQYAIEPKGTLQSPPEKIEHVAIVQPGSDDQSLTVELGDTLPNTGTMRVRVRASRATDGEKSMPSLRLMFGFRSTNEGATVQRVDQRDVLIEAPLGKPEFYQWDIPLSELEHRNTYRGKRKLGEQPSPSEYIRIVNSTLPGERKNERDDKGDDSGDPDTADDSIDYGDGAVMIDYVEISAPVYKVWPPKSHRMVFFESEHSKGLNSPGLSKADGEGTDEESGETVNEGNEEAQSAYAKEIITAFMTRAWRGTASKADIDRKFKLYQSLRPVSTDFQEAINEVLATVLTSPQFLYVLPGQSEQTEDTVSGQETKTEKPKSEAKGKRKLSPSELATRLSLFLWCSLPDQELLELANAGRLDDDKVLQQQIDRMLADPRSKRFNEHFVTQWLKMQPLEYLSPSKDQGKNSIDEALLESMKQEPVELFADMLKRDASLLEFIDSDYLVVNERLANHYGIPDVAGNYFRHVSLPAELNRGGLLTQAGLLALNSDGKDSHPVKRGVWLLTNLLNDPPPPAPAAVPEIDLTDPAIAKMTLKERIEDHRNQAACMSCHEKIDPWGIVFENYDALGRWREEVNDKAVDSTSELPGNVRLDGINGVKKFLVEERREEFTRATIEKMAAFAMGRQLSFGDRAAVTALTAQVQESGGGIKTLVFELAKSPLFRAK